MDSRSLPPTKRAASFVVVAALLLSLAACGNRLPKRELLADNAGGMCVAQKGPVTDTGTGAVSNSGASTAAVLAGSGAGAPAATGTGAGTGTGAATNSSASAGKTTPSKTQPLPVAGTGQAACTGPKSEIAIGTVGGQSGFIGTSVRSGIDAITVFYNVPWALTSSHNNSFPQDLPSYFVNGVCSPDAAQATAEVPRCPNKTAATFRKRGLT